jgi:hypothetical protein
MIIYRVMLKFKPGANSDRIGTQYIGAGAVAVKPKLLIPP